MRYRASKVTTSTSAFNALCMTNLNMKCNEVQILGPETYKATVKWRKSHDEVLHNLCCSFCNVMG
jgi:hypothetical protein